MLDRDDDVWVDGLIEEAEEPRNDWYMPLKWEPRKEPTDAKD